MSRPISDQDLQRIKAATRDLVRGCGGLDRAAEIALLSRSELSRCQSPTAPSIISIPAAVALEAECGVPYVTQAMAAIQGRTLSGPDGDDGHEAVDPVCAFAQTVDGFGKVMSAWGQAHWDDVVTPTEAERMDRLVGEMQGHLDRLRDYLASKKAPIAGAVVVPMAKRGR
jgi:hypothetical protein